MPNQHTRDLPHDALPVSVVADRLQGVLVAAVAAVAAAPRPGGELAHPRPAWARAGLQTVGEELERCVITVMYSRCTFLMGRRRCIEGG